MKTVVVFGAGPAGLLAVHAAVQAGADVDLYSLPEKSQLYGSQYLHMPIPGVPCGDPRIISVEFNGTPDLYRRKVYGENYTGPVSPGSVASGHAAWDIRAMYDWLWEKYGSWIVPMNMSRANVDDVYQMSLRYDFAFCSVPLKPLCHTGPDDKPHAWHSQAAYAVGDAPDLGVSCPIGCHDETIRYDGTRDVGWYRSSRIFEHTTCEWPAHGRKPPLQNIASITKPLWTDCNCFPNWNRIGRYGEWKKGVLTHHAYLKVWDVIGAGSQSALFERP